jgi:hypothetical protein
MPLKKIPLPPGFDKNDTASQAEGRWIDGDNVRFQYGSPEKIGGWSQIGFNILVGAARDIHSWFDLTGRRYVVIGTNKVLYVLFGEELYDITPLKAALTGCTYTSTTGSTTVTINKTSHNFEVGDLLLFSSVTTPGSPTTSFTTADFETNTFQVISVPNANTFTVTMPVAESGTGVTAGGTITTDPYETVGPIGSTFGYGYGTGYYGGTIPISVITTLNGDISNTTTTVTVVSTTGFPTPPPNGRIDIGTELISYTGKTATTFTGCTRGIDGSTAASHLNAATVTNATDWTDWGEQSNTNAVTLDAGSWSLDNFGELLIATIKNGKTFSWDPNAGANVTTRATVLSGNPTASVLTRVSDRDRHLIHFGTETAIGSPASQDPMFIRFSDQEDIEVYEPTSTNTAGTFRLDNGSKIITAVKGKDYMLVLTDEAAYTMQFVGPPFTFSIRQVGSNCGCIGQHAAVFVDGAVYWMGDSGNFFVFDGTVKTLPSSVENFVFTTTGDALGLNFTNGELVFAGHNSLFTEISWFYPQATSTQIDRVVTYNYELQSWVTGSLSRTTYEDSHVLENPTATQYIDTLVPNIPTINGVTASGSYVFEHEVGVNEVIYTTSTLTTNIAISAFVKSGDFDLDIDGDGEYFIKIRRFIPDFKYLDGNTKVTLFFKAYPADTTSAQGETTVGPFTVTSTTDKIDTRARGRLAAIKIENDALDDNWRYGIFRVDIQPDGRGGSAPQT